MPEKPLVTASVDQALQQAIQHHQAGRFQEAEQLYRAILRVDPKHPEANHNLGVLAVSIRQPGGGLAHFKVALEADPNRSQYWLSYIDALLQCDRHDVAVQVLAQARERGLKGDAMELLGQRATGAPAASIEKPDIAEMKAFRHLCDGGEYSKAEALARSMTHRFPRYGEAWKALGIAINFQGRQADALACMQRAAQLLPRDAGAHLNLGSVLHDLGRLEQAELAYRQALLVAPDSVEARNNLGLLLRGLNRFEESESEFRHAVRLDPHCAVAHYNLGNLLYERERYDESVSAYRQALHLKPDYAEAHYDLANALTGLDRLDEAIESYRRAIDIRHNGSQQRDDMIAARIGLETALGRTVPLWHAQMMNDGVRNEAYLNALRSAVTPTTRVFEIGTGSGLLAMMAARCGAGHVATCEAVPKIAATAREIIAENGMALSVLVIGKKSTEITVGIELPQRANLLISEIVANDLLAEGILPSIEDAKGRLLEPNAHIIPAAASIVFALFGGEELKQNVMAQDVCGFKLGRFNSILQRRSTLLRQDLNIDLLTDDTEAFCFDFASNHHFPAESRTLRVPITASGRCHGMIQWIRLRLDQTNTYENHPCRRTPATSWGAVVYRLPELIDVACGQIARVRVSHDRRNSYLFFEGMEQG